ncbi:hypothetical protein B0H21DRAFT_826230 [Amylocystis lapponica]|nr:hypothetical protein B0H21DRAFT_826230 [Amylocystis lapponica]
MASSFPASLGLERPAFRRSQCDGYGSGGDSDSDIDMRRMDLDDGAVMPLRDDPRFDEDGNFYGRGRDTFAGPVAKADDIDKFWCLLAMQSRMEVALMPHQTIGVAWMLEKEKGYYHGGCLGDEMGLGKTVQMIAVMVSRRSDDPMCKTNLIIAPMSLLDQWQQEI